MKSLVLILVFLATSCGSLPQRTRDVVIDCTESSVVAMLPEFEPLVFELLAKLAGSDGQIDWAQAEKALVHLGVRDGGCLLADLQGKLAVLRSAKTATMTEGLGAAIEDYRARRWPGVAFKFANGVR